MAAGACEWSRLAEDTARLTLAHFTTAIRKSPKRVKGMVNEQSNERKGMVNESVIVLQVAKETT